VTGDLKSFIFWAGLGQLSVLIASALVPIRLEWRKRLAPLPPLIRQLFWIYGGYVVFTIISLGVICSVFSGDLAQGTPLARCLCGYAALFWGFRLALQTVLDARPFLTTGWLRAGYHTLTLLFTGFTLIFGWAVFH
jgi:hypothetical protein